MRVDEATDKVSVTGMIHYSTQGHDPDQRPVMAAAQRARESPF